MKHLLVTALLFVSIYGKGQFYFNFSESQIRNTFSSQADKIDVLTISGEKTIMVQLYSTVYAFKLNKQTELCDWYSVRVDDPQLVLKWVDDFTNKYTVLVEGQKWKTKFKSMTVGITRRYTASTNAISFLFYKIT